MNFVFKSQINRNLKGIKRANKVKINEDYYYRICEKIKLHKFEKIEANLSKKYKNFKQGASLFQKIKCIIQNDNSSKYEDLKTTFKATKKVLKIKKSKVRKNQIEKIESETSFTISSRFITFVEKLKQKEFKFKKIESILLNFSKNDEDKFNNSRAFYLKLRGLFIILIKKVHARCSSQFTEK